MKVSICWLLILIIFSQLSIQAQELGNNIYTLSLSYEAPAAYHIWSLSPDTEEPNLIFSSETMPLALMDVPLPEGELELARQSLPPETSSYEPGYRILTVKPVFDGKFVIVTNNQLCNPFNRNYCYGYYELFLLDPASPEAMRSLLQLDYHDTTAWTNCSYDPVDRIYLSGLSANPTQPFVVVTIQIDGCLSTTKESDKNFLIDYLKTSAAITEFWSVGGLAWSPDGTSLAYPSLEGCDEGFYQCDVSFNILSLEAPKSPQKVINERSLSGLMEYIQPLWVGNGLVYPITFDPGGDNRQHKLIYLDLLSGNKRDLISGSIYLDLFLWNENRNTIVGLAGNHLQLISLDTGEVLKEIPEVRLAYSYPFVQSIENYILVIPSSETEVLTNPASVFGVDAELNILDFNIQEQIPDENIIFAAS